jgi:galactokinase
MTRKSIITQSPGRINLIGEHTDYNDGFVLPAAINKKAIFRLTKNGTDKDINIYSENIGNHFSFELDNFNPIENGWENYVMGVINELQKFGAKLKGFDGQFGGDVPIGSGMSSSAALECSLSFGLNELFDLGLNKWQLIKVSQMAEHNFVGVKCGIMDQFTSMMGKKNHVMLLDCRSLEYQYFPFDLGEYQLLLLNTNVSHELASTEYNTRREECELGVEIIKNKFLGIKKLRDVTLEMLQQNINKLPEKVFKRCRHIITENQRVLDATSALVKNDFHQLGQLIYQSHISLQKDYEVSCPELDFLVNLTLKKKYILGSRMMGGGFGGCTINLIDKKQIAKFIEIAAKEYQLEYGKNLTPYLVSIENGSGIIEK